MMLDTTTINIIRELQNESIVAKQLTTAQLDIIYANNWFNIWVSKKYNGLSLSLLDGFTLLKDLAYVDGGFSWTVTLCSGANMFAGYLDPNIATEVFKEKQVCFGGSGRAGGKAIFNGENYTITGSWQYATGAPHLSHFTLNAYIYDGNIQRKDEEGNPIVYSFFVPREYILIHYDWDTFGLECTASHSFSLNNIVIDQKYAFQLHPNKRKVDDVIYRIPFMTFAELTLLPNYLGMYQRFLDLVEKYYFEKSKDDYWATKYSKKRFRQLDQYQQQFAQSINHTESLIDNLVQEASKNETEISEDLLSTISVSSKNIVKDIREATTILFPLVGILGAQKDNEINIVFRNLFTATQHSLLNLVD